MRLRRAARPRVPPSLETWARWVKPVVVGEASCQDCFLGAPSVRSRHHGHEGTGETRPLKCPTLPWRQGQLSRVGSLRQSSRSVCSVFPDMCEGAWRPSSCTVGQSTGMNAGPATAQVKILRMHCAQVGASGLATRRERPAAVLGDSRRMRPIAARPQLFRQPGLFHFAHFNSGRGTVDTSIKSGQSWLV